MTVNLLFVCTGNQCRSPMAAGLARRALAERKCPAEVSSAGFVAGGVPPAERAVVAMADVGVDIGDARSRMVDAALIEAGDLVVAMTRQHLLDVIVLVPEAWERCFTLVDLVRRGEATGPRGPTQSVASWVKLLGVGRQRSKLIGLPAGDDIPDPMGGSPRDFTRTRDRLVGLVDPLVRLLCPAA